MASLKRNDDVTCLATSAIVMEDHVVKFLSRVQENVFFLDMSWRKSQKS